MFFFELSGLVPSRFSVFMAVMCRTAFDTERKTGKRGAEHPKFFGSTDLPGYIRTSPAPSAGARI